MSTPGEAVAAAIGERAPGVARARPWWSVARRLLRDPIACVALAVLLLFVASAVAAPLVAPHAPNHTDAFHAFAASSSAHLLGTDENGRDVLSRVMYGGRVSLSVGVIAVGIGIAVGVPLGLLAAYFGGVVDLVLMRVMDALLAFPALILALALVAILGLGLTQLMVAIGITSIPVYARVVRSQALSVKTLDFVVAAETLGAGTGRIVFRHILPNTLAPVIVQASLGMAFAVLAEAGLSFLGLGVRPPTATWGGMLQQALAHLNRSTALSIYPGTAIFLAVLALNVLGDALRDLLDPRLQGGRG